MQKSFNHAYTYLQIVIVELNITVFNEMTQTICVLMYSVYRCIRCYLHSFMYTAVRKTAL